MRALIRRPPRASGPGPRWMLLLAFALAVLAVAGVTSSGAVFTSQVSAPATASAGDLEVVNSKEGAAVLDGSHMRPGMSRQGTVSVTNRGDYSVAYTLEPLNLTDTPASAALSNVLDLTVTDTGGGATVYAGKLGAMGARALGTFAVDEQRTYRFTLSWPAAAADPSRQGASTSVTFRWSGGT